MRTPILVSALCVLILAAPASSRAADPAVATRIGPVSLSLPSPDGFTEPSVLVPQLRQIGETMTPPTNRLLALFVSDGDVKLAVSGKEPELTRYFMVQTLRKTEANVVTTNEFLRLRNLLRGQYQELLSRVAPRVQGHLDSAARSIGKDSGIPDLSLRVGELRAVEIFDDRSTSISLLALTKYLFKSPEKSRKCQ